MEQGVPFDNARVVNHKFTGLVIHLPDMPYQKVWFCSGIIDCLCPSYCLR